MRKDMLRENCIYAFASDMEVLFALFSLLNGESQHPLCAQIYEGQQIAAWKRRYCFLTETFDAVKELNPIAFFDFVLDVYDEGFTLKKLRRHILRFSGEERVFRMLGWPFFGETTKEDVGRALTDDEALDALYARVQDKCRSFLGFSSFVRQSTRYLDEFFALAAEMDTPALREAIKANAPRMQTFRKDLAEMLKTSDGMECSEKLMKKTFRNRGPYEEFLFVPSLLLPFHALRLFYDNDTAHNRQILFYSIRPPKDRRAEIAAALKALSDETRYQILVLLGQSGPIKGQEIAQRLKLAPSTVSHHMTELKARGLISEEPVKTAKYYGLSRDGIKELLKEIEDDLEL